MFFLSVSPDGAWLVARVAQNAHAGNAIVAFAAQDGRAVLLCVNCEADWAPGGKTFVIRALVREKSIVISLAPGESLPRLPATGLRTEADVASIERANVVDGFRYPGRDANQYAFKKSVTQRNIFRVPLP